jgi:hypothetical protein
LIRRETQGGNRSDEARQFWAQPRVMSVPAWELSITAVKQAGIQMLKQPPVLKAIPRPSGAKLTPAVVSAEDARKMLEFLIRRLTSHNIVLKARMDNPASRYISKMTCLTSLLACLHSLQ